MSISYEKKQAVVSEIAAKLREAQVLIMAEYRGMDVASVTELRSRARGAGVSLHVYKNSLARRAVRGTPFEALSGKMVGPLMYGFSTDPVVGAKLLADFAKQNEFFAIKAGAMPNAVMSGEDVTALAALPGRQELLAQLVGTMQAPVAKFVRTLNEVPAKFVRTLAAVRDEREKSAA